MNKNQITTYFQDIPWQELTLKVNKLLPTWVLVVLSILLVQTAAEITWKLITPAEDKPLTIKMSTPPSFTRTKKASLNEVSQYHLFGDAKKQPLAQQKIIEAPETRLRLNLKGVFATSESANALAIISSGKNKDKTYHIGDKVIGGALLHAVYADRVILKRNGQLETLRLPKPKVDNKNFSKVSLNNKRMLTNLRATTQTADKKLAQVPSQNLSQQQQLRQMRDTLLKDPAKIWQQVRINPVMENGKVKGYTMMHNDQKLMKALNIRNTDIITSINGQPLSDPATLYGLMSSLSDQQSLELAILRNGQPQSIQLSF